MQSSLSLQIVACLSESGFSMDELAAKPRESFLGDARAARDVDQDHRPGRPGAEGADLRPGGQRVDQGGRLPGKSRDKIFSYARFWLETGLVSPRVRSWIERIMREVTRPLKRIAFGWSEEGVARMTRITVKRICDEKARQDDWHKRLNIAGNVELIFRGAKLTA